MTRVALVVALLTVPLAAAAQTPGADSAVNACLARDTATVWKQVAEQWSAAADTAGSWSNDSLRRVLLALGRRDQAVRSGPDLADSLDSPAFRQRMAQADSADASALQDVIAQFGWPTRAMVGVQGAGAAFLIVQHNPGMQFEALTLMRALPAGQYSPADFATLDDRWLVANGRPQLFGTQLHLVGNGPMRFDSIADPARLDGRRARAGLPPLTVYACMLQAMYGRPVAAPPRGGERHR